jgi:tetratricopeptide (TPR) repeat protein
LIFAAALARVARAPDDVDELDDLARAALAEGEEERALQPLVRAAQRADRDARLWQWVGLLERSLDRHRQAIPAFDRAARTAPGDAGIAHGRARIALEAGLPAVPLFELASRLAPNDAGVLLGRAAARFATGDATTAIAELDGLVAANPGWIEGHDTLAQLQALTGNLAVAGESYERALARDPRYAPLWHALVAMYVRSENHAAALDAIGRARRCLVGTPELDANEAICRSELGDLAGADRFFSLPTLNGMAGMAVWRVRQALRKGDVAGAAAVLDRDLDPADSSLWPYASIVWRLAGDPRAHWLDGDERLVSVIDLDDALPELDRLATVLRGLHRAQAAHLDQSVRGGTQTDGPLLSRIEPEIERLRARIVHAVERHVAQLPPIDARHPTLRWRRDRPVRFAGSWSVRLAGQGHHANHVHPHGWLSSAFYVSLPDEIERSASRAGWLTLGQPQAALGLDLPPTRVIAPRPGRLVLFPSTMWHGTVPFAAGERLTVAFDVAPPR